MSRQLSLLLETYVADGFDVATDMLTRTSLIGGDMVSDASVFSAARDPETGGRQLEALAFQVVTTKGLVYAARKARALSARGVRRVFAIDVGRRRAFEWSRRARTWKGLSLDGVLKDRALVLPLPLRAIVEGEKVDDAIARALLAKKNPVVEAALRVARLEGMLEGRAEALLKCPRPGHPTKIDIPM